MSEKKVYAAESHRCVSSDAASVSDLVLVVNHMSSKTAKQGRLRELARILQNGLGFDRFRANMFAAGLLHSEPGDERQELVSTILASDSGLRNSSSKTLQLVFSRETGEFVDVIDSAASDG